MNFLETLGDLSLRRLYKFILKSMIGRYLENELLIDQLSVRSRDGLVTLSDISLNCDVLNDEILQASSKQLPFRITKATVRSFEAKVSYSLLLAEGCQVHANGLEIILEPYTGKPSHNPSANQKKTNTNTTQNHLDREEDSNAENNYSNDSANSLEFIAKWIEIIVASLQFHINDVVLRLNNPSGDADIKFSFSKVSYYNTHPQSLRSNTDTSLSFTVKSSQTFAGSSMPQLGATKLIRFESFEASLVRRKDYCSEENFITIQRDISIQLRERNNTIKPCSECDINVSPMTVQASLELAIEIVQLLNSFLASSGMKNDPPTLNSNNSADAIANLMKIDPGVGALLWLQDQMNRKSVESADGDIDYSKLIDLLKQNYDVRLKSSMMGSENLIKTPTDLSASLQKIEARTQVFVKDDDVEFPDTDDEGGAVNDVNEDEFYDAVEGKSISRIKFGGSISNLSPKKYSDKTQIGRSVRFDIDDQRSESKPKCIRSYIRDSSLRVRFTSVDFSLLSEPTNLSQRSSFQIQGNEIIFHQMTKTFSVDYVSENDKRIESVSNIIFTIGSLHICESVSEKDAQNIPWLTFYHKDAESIIRYPQHVQINISFGDDCDEFSKSKTAKDGSSKSEVKETIIDLKLEPIVFSASLSRLNFWSSQFSKIFRSVQLAPDADSSFATNLSLEIGEVHMLLHPEKSLNDHDSWDDFSEALDLSNFPDRWMAIPTEGNHMNRYSLGRVVGQHLRMNQSKAGIHVKLSDLTAGFDSTRFSAKKACDNMNPNSILRAEKSKTFQNQGISLQQLDIYMFAEVKREDSKSDYFETLILAALNNVDVEGSKILLQYFSSKTDDAKQSITNLEKSVHIFNNDNQEGRVLYNDEEALQEPQSGDESNIVHLYSYRIAIDVRQRELCALVSLSDYFLPPKSKVVTESSNTTSNDSQSAVQKPASSIRLGILFHSEIATIRISENRKNYYERYRSTDLPSSDDESMCICLSVTNPIIKVISSDFPKQQYFFSIQAEDMAMFEFTNDQYESSLSRYNFSKKKTNHLSRSARFGPLAHFVPFVHRTTLHSKSGKWDLKDGSAFGRESKYGLDSTQQNWDHTFRLQLLLSNDLYEGTDDIVKLISFHMSFQDVTLRYDPSSAWFIRVIELMTPRSPQQILQRRKVSNTDTVFQKSSKSDQNMKKVAVFETTKATVRVRKCLIDYCCDEAPSRLLFSVGMLTMSTTIVSNNPKFSMKFSVRDISLHISNRLTDRKECEQSPLDPDGYRSELLPTDPFSSILGNQKSNWIDMDTFLDEHLFVQLLTLDYKESFVTFHDDASVMNQMDISSAISMKINIGLCCVYACVDSLAILGDTMLSWWNDFKTMIEATNKSSTVTKSDKSASLTSTADSVGEKNEAGDMKVDLAAIESKVDERHEESTDTSSNLPLMKIVTLADLGDDSDIPYSSVKSRETRKDSEPQKHSNTKKPNEKATVLHPLDNLKPEAVSDLTGDHNKDNTVTTKFISTPAAGWMNKIQPSAFAAPLTSPAYNNHNGRENKGINNLPDITDYLVNSGYYGKDVPRPPSPEFETRWIPQYGDEDLDNGNEKEETDSLWDDIQSMSESMMKSQQQIKYSDSESDDEREGHFVIDSNSVPLKESTSQNKSSQQDMDIHEYFDGDDSSHDDIEYTDNDAYEPIQGVPLSEEVEQYLERVDALRSSYYSKNLMSSNRPFSPTKPQLSENPPVGRSIMLDNILQTTPSPTPLENSHVNGSFLERSVLIDDSHVTFDEDLDEDIFIDDELFIDNGKGNNGIDMPKEVQDGEMLQSQSYGASMEHNSTSVNNAEEGAERVDVQFSPLLEGYEQSSYMRDKRLNIHDSFPDDVYEDNDLLRSSRNMKETSSLFWTSKKMQPKESDFASQEYELDDFGDQEYMPHWGQIDPSQDPYKYDISSDQDRMRTIFPRKAVDFDRFDAVDGVHNALQITIGETVSFRRAGIILANESNSTYDDVEPTVSLTNEIISQNSALEIEDRPESTISNQIIDLDMDGSDNMQVAMDQSTQSIAGLSFNPRNQEADIEEETMSDTNISVNIHEYKNINVDEPGLNEVRDVRNPNPKQVPQTTENSNDDIPTEVMNEQSQLLESSESKYYRRVQNDTNFDSDMELAWRITSINDNSTDFLTKWYMEPQNVKVDQFYVPIPSAVNISDNDIQTIPSNEKILPVSMSLNVKASVRIRLFGGADWSDSPLPVPIEFKEKIYTVPRDDPPSKHVKASKRKGKSIDGEDSNLFESHMSIKMSDSSNSKISSRKSSSKYSGSAPRELFDRQIVKKNTSSAPKRRKPFTLKTREQEDMLDVAANGVSVTLRVYDLKKLYQSSDSLDDDKKNLLSVNIPPCQRLIFRMNDFLVSYQRQGHRRIKVLGWWKSSIPREPGIPLLHVILVGYPTNDPRIFYNNMGNSKIDEYIEHRVVIALLPLRVYLNPFLIDFLKQLAERQKSIDQSSKSRAKSKISKERDFNSEPSPNDAVAKELTNTRDQSSVINNVMYFQMISVRKFDIKIDYNPAEINLQALNQGDYLQLLNLFPLKGLTITLKRIRLTGVSGIPALLEQIIFAWVEDIYQNQLHRVISGTSALRGIANIGQNLHDLIVIPLNRDASSNQGSNNKKMIRNMQTKASDLIQTVTREALHVSHKLTMFVAKGISELASNDTPAYQQRYISNQRGPEGYGNAPDTAARNVRQPAGLNDGILRGYESLRREVSSAVESIVAIPIREYRRTGSSKTYVKSVIRALPVAVLKPIAGAAEGVSYTLLGLRNSIDPNARTEDEDIWEVDRQLHDENW